MAVAQRGNPLAMGEISELDELFPEAVERIVLEAQEPIGNDPPARLEFFRRLLAVAREVVANRGQRVSCT